MEEHAVVIERVFDAPIEVVWRMWTDPEMVKKWWGPEGFTAPYAKIDLKVGGKYVFAMHGPAGSEWDKDMYSAGVYKEIIPPSSISRRAKIVTTDYFSDDQGNKMKPAEYGQDSTFPDEMMVTITFEEIEKNKTKLTITYPKPESEEHLQAMLKSGMKQGWSQSMDKMAEALKV